FSIVMVALPPPEVATSWALTACPLIRNDTNTISARTINLTFFILSSLKNIGIRHDAFFCRNWLFLHFLSIKYANDKVIKSITITMYHMVPQPLVLGSAVSACLPTSKR